MSLNWKISDIKDYKRVCFQTHVGTQEEMEEMVNRVTFMGPDWSWPGQDDRSSVVRMHPRTHTLIFSCMSLGMGEITEVNWEEFYARLHVLERVHGSLLMQDGLPVYFTPDDVRRHIGLRVNVAEEKRPSFERRIMRGLREEAIREARKKGAA